MWEQGVFLCFSLALLYYTSSRYTVIACLFLFLLCWSFDGTQDQAHVCIDSFISLVNSACGPGMFSVFCCNWLFCCLSSVLVVASAFPRVLILCWLCLSAIELHLTGLPWLDETAQCRGLGWGFSGASSFLDKFLDHKLMLMWSSYIYGSEKHVQVVDSH